MIHLQNAATQMIEEFAKHGFNGVQFEDCRMCPARLEDFLMSGDTEEDYLQWIEEYACFILQPRREVQRRGTIYDVAYFDDGQFEDDLEAEMRRRFGDITINSSPGCYEYEIFRKDK